MFQPIGDPQCAVIWSQVLKSHGRQGVVHARAARPADQVQALVHSHPTPDRDMDSPLDKKRLLQRVYEAAWLRGNI